MFPYFMNNTIVIPQTATFEVQDKVYVYKVIDGRATASIINVFSVNDGKNYIVKDGLEEGDVIVIEGVGIMKEGTPISTTDTAKSKTEKK